nr:hypothetical protein [Tanacetum cinerariifolium]
MKIESLKRRVKKLKKKQRSRTHKRKRLYMAGLTARVDSSDEAKVSAIGKVNVVSTATTTIDDITLAQALMKLKDKGKAIMIEEPVKLKKKDQIMLDEEVALKLQTELQAEFDKEQRLASEKAQQEEEFNSALIEEWNDIQANIDVKLLMKKLDEFGEEYQVYGKIVGIKSHLNVVEVTLLEEFVNAAA